MTLYIKHASSYRSTGAHSYYTGQRSILSSKRLLKYKSLIRNFWRIFSFYLAFFSACASLAGTGQVGEHLRPLLFLSIFVSLICLHRRFFYRHTPHTARPDFFVRQMFLSQAQRNNSGFTHAAQTQAQRQRLCCGRGAAIVLPDMFGRIHLYKHTPRTRAHQGRRSTHS